MNNFRIKLGNTGRVLIPVPCRKQLHLQPGEELILRVKNGELHLSSLKNSLKKAQEIVQRLAKGQNLVEKLMQMRREDSNNE